MIRSYLDKRRPTAQTSGRIPGDLFGGGQKQFRNSRGDSEETSGI